MEPTPLAQAAGASARQIRLDSGATLSDTAKVARFYGLSWSSGKVGDFEAGKVSPTLPTLIAVAATLSDVSQRDVGLADLFVVKGRIAINDRLSVSGSDMGKWLLGDPVVPTAADLTGEMGRLIQEGRDFADEVDAWPGWAQSMNSGIRRPVAEEFSEGDLRVAKRLGLSRGLAVAAMAELWGRTFIAERDARCGAGASAQSRGHVSRQMTAELKSLVDGDDK